MRTVTRDNLPHLVWRAQAAVGDVVTTSIGRMIASWWGVALGPRCAFRGLPVIRRFPGSTITVGANSKFNSATKSHQGGISRPCFLWTLSPQAEIRIGDGSGFSGTVISAERSIRIGRNVRCGSNSHISDSDMHSDDPRVGGARPVVIEDDVWLGRNCMVLKGVTIGRGTLVGANSLVNKSLPPYCIAAGSPARVIRQLSEHSGTQEGADVASGNDGDPDER